MRIGIILNPYGIKNPSGLSRFILNLTLELIKQSPEDYFVLFIKGHFEVTDFKEYKNVEIQFIRDSIFWKDSACIKNRDVDVWVYNNLSLPIVLMPKKSIAIALDFGNFYDYERTSLERSLAIKLQKIFQGRSMRKATCIVCTSVSTKNDIYRFFPEVSKNKILVSMCGYTPPCDVFYPEPIKDLPESFYLLVGVIKQRKNQLTAIEAFISAKEKGLRSHLVITGKGAGTYCDEVMDLIAKSSFKKDIHYLGYRSNEEMVTLYQSARALMFPSHVEGFGMPILEAMSCGTPVIISSHPSLLEAAEDAALVSDSSDVQGFANALVQFEDDQLREEYKQKGLLQAKKFSWKRSASEYLDILHDLNNQSV